MSPGIKVRIGLSLLSLVLAIIGAVMLFPALGWWGLAGLSLWSGSTNIVCWVTTAREAEQRLMLFRLLEAMERIQKAEAPR